jgi:hypothetical protein
VVGLAFVLVYVFAYDSIYQAHAMVTASIPAPMVVAILLGVLWRRFTPAACLATLVGGSALIGLSFVFPDQLVGPFSFGMGPDSYKFMRALYGLTVCGAIGIVMTLISWLPALFEWLFGPVSFDIGPDSNKFLRALCNVAAVVVTYVTRPKPSSELVGLVTGTEVDAMRLYKGAEPNRTPGKKVRLTLRVDPDLQGSDAAVVPQTALDRMSAGVGDILYVCHRWWWFGGLRSVHVRAGEPSGENEVRVSPEALEIAHLDEGQQVVVEKIL